MTHQDEQAGRILRAKILNTTAGAANISPSAGFPRVWGVAMDWHVSEEAIATVVSLADGTASLYTTASFGIIGAGEHESVQLVARKLVRAADAHLDDAKPAGEYPYPELGTVNFFLLTFDGVHHLEAEGTALADGTHPLSPLFGRAQQVVTEMRRLDDGSAEKGPDFVGVPGYFHCLMTAMSRGAVSRIEVSADAPLPDLERLSSGDAEIAEWVGDQGFDYGALPPAELIRLVRSEADFGALSFLSRKGVMEAFDMRPDGSVKACLFDVEIAPGKSGMTITLAPDDDPRMIKAQRKADKLKKKVDKVR